jgi:hypothetical protein
MVFSIVVSYMIYQLKFSYNTRRNSQKISDELYNLKRIVQQQNTITADNFLINRAALESPKEIVGRKPKVLRYSGGPLLFILEDEDFKNYLKENTDIEVKFIFPDYSINHVIRDFVNNITVGENVKNYKDDIKRAVDLVKRINVTAKSKITYKFCNFAPSFGLQIIENDSDNNNRLYVDLYTMGIAKTERYQFKIEKENSRDTYDVFQEQFNKLWNKSNQKPIMKKRKLSKFLCCKTY